MTSSAQPSKGALAVRRPLVIEEILAHLDLILTIRAMEMNRVCAWGVIDKTHYRLGSLAHHESRAWCDAIVANQFSLAQVRVDLQSDQYLRHRIGFYISFPYLLFEWLDINFVIVNWWAAVGGESP